MKVIYTLFLMALFLSPSFGACSHSQWETGILYPDGTIVEVNGHLYTSQHSVGMNELTPSGTSDSWFWIYSGICTEETTEDDINILSFRLGVYTAMSFGIAGFFIGAIKKIIVDNIR